MKTHWQILVVDDDEVMCESLAAWLREDGYTVDTAASGRQAVEKARARDFAIYFVDLKMPGGMDGIETMMQVRRLHPDASIIIITAYATVDTAITAMKEGAQGDSDYEPLLNLSTYANVYIKISGFYAFTEHQPDYPYHDLAPFLKRLLEKFGSRRMLWGSDAPPVLDFSSYEQTFACLRHLLPGTSKEDLASILGGTAKKLFIKE